MIKMESEPSQRGSIGGKGFEAFLFLKQAGRMEDVLTSSLGLAIPAYHPPRPVHPAICPCQLPAWLAGF